MKNLSKTILAVAVAGAITVGLAQQSQAVPVVGNINFGGSVTLNTSSAGTATGVTSWSGFGTGGKPQVQNRDGSFVGFVAPGDAVTFVAPWTFNTASTITGFWQVDGFSFDLNFSSSTHTASSVTVDGTGIISGNGFTPTAGIWHFTTQDPGTTNGGITTFSFSAASGFVPEGGSAAALLGIA